MKPIDVILYPFRTSPFLALICVWMPFFSLAVPAQNRSSTSFIENKGQIIDQNNKYRTDIDFKLSLSGINIFIGKGQLHYQWTKTNAAMPQYNTAIVSNVNSQFSIPDSTITIYRMDVSLMGANTDAVAESSELQTYYENYYLPQCADGIKARSYNKIVYKNVYPNIDWVLYVANSKETGSLKYDFIVHEGGNPSDIKLRYEGATDLKLENKALVTTTPFGIITEQAPYSYEAQTGKRINSSFALEGNALSFKTEKYDGSLVIDPKILWATYLGGNGDEYAGAITEDSFGHIYLAGCTSSTSNIATSGAYQYQYAAGSTNTYDAFLAKYSDNDTLLWSTYYGGEGIERGSSVACDPSGNIFLSGETGIISTSGGSTNGSLTGLSTPGCYQAGYAGRGDVFLAKFDSTGVRQWGTYIGGSDVDDNGVLTCDDSGNVFVAGWTLSTDSIATATAYQSTHAGTISAFQYDGFIMKFNGAGIRLWGTYYGGDTTDRITSIAYNRAGSFLYAGGYTMSINNILASGAVGTINGLQDGFLANFNAMTGQLKWGMYYGGTANDAIMSVSCDKTGNLCFGGITNSDNGIAAGIAHQSSRSGGWDAFAGKVNSQGQKLWATYIGGSGDEEMWGVCANEYGGLFPAVRTSSSGLPVPLGFQTSNAGQNDAYIASFSPEGYFNWATYYGGTGDENMLIAPGYGNANILCSKRGSLYTCGNTSSQSGITAGAAHQSTYGGGNSDAYLAKLYNDTTIEIVKPFIDTLKCVGDSMFVLTRATNYFKTGNVFTVQLSDSSGSFDNNNTTIIGTRTSVYDGDVIAHIPVNQVPGTHYKVRVISSNPKDTSADDGKYIRISQYPIPSASSNAPVCEGGTLNLFVSSPIHIEQYLWLGPNGFISTNFFPVFTNVPLTATGRYIIIADNYSCKAKDSIDVFIKPRPAQPHIISNDTSFCIGDSLWLSTSLDTGITFTWQTPQGFFPFTANTRTVSNLTMADSGVYRLATTFNYNNCTSKSDTVNIEVHPIPTPVATVNSPVCSGTFFNLKVSDTTYNVKFSWIGPAGFKGKTSDTVINNSKTTQSGAYIVTANAFNCIGKDTVELLVKPTPPKPALSSNSPVCSGEELNLKATDSIANVHYTWAGPAGFSANTPNVTTTASINASGMYKVTAELDGCQTADSIAVLIRPTPHPDIKANSPVIIGEDLYLQMLNPQSGYSYIWTGPNGFASDTAEPVIRRVTTQAAGKYTIAVTADGCTGTNELTVDVNAPDTNYVVLYPNPNNGNFTIKGYTHINQDIPLRILDAAGRLLYKENVSTVARMLRSDISLPSAANGVYLLQLRIDGAATNIPFTIKR